MVTYAVGRKDDVHTSTAALPVLYLRPSHSGVVTANALIRGALSRTASQLLHSARAQLCVGTPSSTPNQSAHHHLPSGSRWTVDHAICSTREDKRTIILRSRGLPQGSRAAGQRGRHRLAPARAELPKQPSIHTLAAAARTLPALPVGPDSTPR